jgi:hypothetical protein
MDWEKVRVNAAIAAMGAMWVNSSYTTANGEAILAELAVERAKLAVKQADALVEALKNKDN